jgi:hypothetical protein
MQELHNILERKTVRVRILEAPHAEDGGWIKEEQKGEHEERHQAQPDPGKLGKSGTRLRRVPLYSI